jgi:hypothetical protein
VDDLYGFVRFTHPQKLFEEFGDLPSDFLRRFYSVSLKTSISHDHLCKMTATDDQGFALEGEFCCSRFRKYWSRSFYSKPLTKFVYPDNKLSKADIATKWLLSKFVGSLEAEPVPDSRYPSSQRKVLVNRYIDTELLLSDWTDWMCAGRVLFLASFNLFL